MKITINKNAGGGDSAADDAATPIALKLRTMLGQLFLFLLLLLLSRRNDAIGKAELLPVNLVIA